MSILKQLEQLEKSNMYPFHMPGHKRQMQGRYPYGIDITEIDGFDDLHDATGILKAAQEKAAKLYESRECFYLVNGSTCGILAAISAAVPLGGKILVARNCHKAVYHAMQLRQARAVYLYPEVDEYGINGAVTIGSVEAAVKAAAEAGDGFDACVITSPTYEGIVSDISRIAQLLHESGIPLIVDAAHGAHFGMHPYFPETPTKLGADVVIMSIHKTLGAPTQTALLHRCTDRISSEQLSLYLDIYETSSPSYVLMAAMEVALEHAKTADWDAYAKRLQNFYMQAARCSITILQMDDPSKIIICGRNLAERLRKDYEIEVEMESYAYVILMTSVFDTDEGFARLIAALQEMKAEECLLPVHREATSHIQEYPIAQAIEMPSQYAELFAAAGLISAEYIYLYPPGIPVFIPGERIEEQDLIELKSCMDAGLAIKGQAHPGKIKVVKDEKWENYIV